MRTDKRKLALEVEAALRAALGRDAPPGVTVDVSVAPPQKTFVRVSILFTWPGVARQLFADVTLSKREPVEWVAANLLRQLSGFEGDARPAENGGTDR